MKMTANRNFRYRGRALTAGDSFAATPQDARLLKALGRATIEGGEPAPAKRGRPKKATTARATAAPKEEPAKEEPQRTRRSTKVDEADMRTVAEQFDVDPSTDTENLQGEVSKARQHYKNRMLKGE